jgi:SAM-dependent methyltransferase
MVLAASLGVGVAGQEPEAGRHGRLYPPRDLGLLEGPDRDAWQKPDETTDVQPQMLEAFRRRVAREGLLNVETRRGSDSDPNLPLRSLDAVLAVDMYPEVADRVTFLRNTAAALKPGGRIGIVNYKPGRGGPGPSPDEGVRVESAAVEKDARAAGLRVLAQLALPYQYLLVLGR